MKRLLETTAVAFSMFSALPMPQFQWNKENMRYAMCAFPFIGFVIGGGVWVWSVLCYGLKFGTVLCAAGFTLIPLLITGGIHLDGLCDTADALASHAPVEKKLEILKDPHLGAFGAMSLAAYLLLQFALFTELAVTTTALWCLALGFAVSRTLSGFAVATFPCAKNSGLLHTFADHTSKVRVRVFLGAFMAILSAALLVLAGWYGAVVLGGALVLFLFYYVLSMRCFGGITGDLAGWFLQLCEIGMLGVLVLAQKLLPL